MSLNLGYIEFEVFVEQLSEDTEQAAGGTDTEFKSIMGHT